MSDTSILMSLEKSVWGDWEQNPMDGGMWKAEWREGWGPLGGCDWTSFEQVTPSQSIKSIRKQRA